MGRKPVGHDAIWDMVLGFQQLMHEFARGRFVTPRLNQDIQYLGLAVHRTPQIHPLPADRDKDLVEVPLAIWPRAQSRQFAGIGRPELLGPVTNSFIGHVDAALSKQILDIAVAERESEVQPDSVLDNGRWEAMSAIGDFLHRRTLSHLVQRNHSVTVTMPAFSHSLG